MISKNYYFQLSIRIILITLTNLIIVSTWLYNYIYSSIFSLILLVIQVILLIKYVNYTNRKIAYFFESIKNEDYTLHFSEQENIKSLKELNKSLNMLNDMMQKARLKNKEQEQYYQKILKQADIGILTFNDKGHILFANPTVEKLLNYTPLNHIKQLALVDKKLYDFFANLKPFEQRLIQLTNEREKTQLALKSTAITIDKQPLLLVVIQDIHKELDEKETDSWVRLIRVLTHEIMNTITPITSISESILKYFIKQNKLISIEEFTEDQIKNTAKGLEVIKEQGNDLMSFVQSYRSFLNVPLPNKKIVSAYKLLERVKLLINQIPNSSNIAFSITVNPKNLELFVEEKQIIQVLLNLSTNALQALADIDGGIINISAGINKNKKKYIEIEDNGSGIPSEYIDEIFVPFFTTKNTGTGIGLSLSKQIMRLHGGTLNVKSNPFKKTVFSLEF